MVMPLVKHQLGGFFSDPKDQPHVYFVLDDDRVPKGRLVNGIKVLGLSEFLATDADIKYFNVAVANPAHRRRIAETLLEQDAVPFPITARTHISLDNNDIQQNSIFCNYTHVTSNVKIGDYFHCNIYSYVEHDCKIGNFVTFAPGVKCNGWVCIEDNVYVGSGAIIRDGTESPIVIGRDSVIGMGAVVTKSVAPGTTVVGSPARPI